MNVNEFKKNANNFLEHIEVERNFSAHTKKAYSNDFNQFAQFWENLNQKLKKENSISDTLDRFFIFLFHKKASSTSIARKVSSFKSLEKYLNRKDIKLGLKLTRPRIEKKMPIYLSKNEMFKILDIEQHDIPSKFPLRDKAILELLYATGIRCSELVNIKIKDINIEQRTIRIKGKGNKERIVPFNSKSQEKILKYLNVERAIIFDYEESLFLNAKNEQLSPRTIQRIIEMFRQFLGINKKITPHKIRHTFATHLLNEGVDIRVLQELLGHSSISSTEKYTHVATTQLREVCNKFHPINDMQNDSD